MNPIVKILIEAGPLVAFFLTNWMAGIFWGTGIFMAATAAALLMSWLLTRKLAVMPLISAFCVLANSRPVALPPLLIVRL